MKFHQAHRNVVLLGVAGLLLILVACLDSLRFRTAASWYYGSGFVVAVHHAGKLSLLHSNIPVPWNPEGFNGQFIRDADPVQAAAGAWSVTHVSKEEIRCNLVEIPHWAILAAFVSFWPGLLVADHFITRIRMISSLHRYV
jgi:hypothetical protein